MSTVNGSELGEIDLHWDDIWLNLMLMVGFFVESKVYGLVFDRIND